MNTYELIRQAIIDKNIVKATYNGYHREMCPHALGYKNGRQKALLYQFGGSSSKGLGPVGSHDNWRCVFVDQMENVAVKPAEGRWYTANDHSRRQTCIDRIETEVDY
jgi:hypothetical protein